MAARLQQEMSMSLRITALLALTLLLAACGRAGPMLRPEPGVTIKKDDDQAATGAVADTPFVLDKLL